MKVSNEVFLRELSWWIFLEVAYRRVNGAAKRKGYADVTRDEFAETIKGLLDEATYTKGGGHA